MEGVKLRYIIVNKTILICKAAFFSKRGDIIKNISHVQIMYRFNDQNVFTVYSLPILKIHTAEHNLNVK